MAIFAAATRRYFSFPIEWGALARLAAVGIAAAVLGTRLAPDGFWLGIVAKLVLLGLVPVILARLGFFSADELAGVRRLLERFRTVSRRDGGA